MLEKFYFVTKLWRGLVQTMYRSIRKFYWLLFN